MNTPLYIARKLGKEKAKITSLVKTIAVLSISLGLAVMILSVAIVTGFQNEIKEKVIGFGSHIQITNLDYNFSYEASPVDKNQDFYPSLSEIEGIKHIQVYATKPGIIKTEDQIHGVVFKGVGEDFDWNFFRERITRGNIPEIRSEGRSQDIVISEFMSNLLLLNPGDDILMYFIQDPPRMRKLKVVAVYETGMEDLDQLFVLGDIAHIQQLNNWTSDQVGGFEVLVDNFEELRYMEYLVFEELPYHLTTTTIQDVYSHIFDWLNLLDMNVYVIIIIMVLVAGINMITTLLINVLEKTNLIGILKALGGNNAFIRKVFIYNAGFMILRGLIIGNILGLGLAFAQDQWGIIRLSQESYFVDIVPVSIHVLPILLLNLGTFAICTLMLVVPSYVVSKVSPVKAITFR